MTFWMKYKTLLAKTYEFFIPPLVVLISLFTDKPYLIVPGLVVIVLLSINSYFYKKGKTKELALFQLEDILSVCVKAVREYQNRQETNTLRANIMVPREENLEILVSYRMENDLDMGITFAYGQGCCGDAFDAGVPVVGDLDVVYRSTWEETREFCGTPPWGITKKHYEMTRDLKAVVSIPLIYRDSVIGILNLDDKIALTDSRFKEGEFLLLVGGYVHHIINVLTQEGC